MAISHLYPTQRPALDLNFARQKRLDSRVTFTRGSTATYVGSDGLIKTAASGEARFDHNPVSGESLGLLVEESRTNLILNSGNWELFAAAKQNITALSSTALAPDGVTLAKELQSTSTSFAASYQTVSLTASTRYTLSAYVKAGTHQNAQIRLFDGSFFAVATFNLSAGTASGGSIERLPNGWFRCSVSGTAVSTTAVGRAYFDFQNPVTTSSTLYFFGAQLEAGSFPTSYIPTTSSTVTRAADVCTVTNSNIYDTDSFTILNEPFGSAAGGSTLSLVGAGETPIKRTAVYSQDLTQTQINASVGKTDEFWRWRVLGSSFALPGFLTNGQVTVDWGDGTIETLTTAEHTFSNGSGYHDIGFRLDSGTYFRPYINGNPSHDTKVVALGPAPESMKLNGDRAFYGCSNLEAFDATVDATGGTNFYRAWNGCSSLTSFPLINTAAGTNFSEAWRNCSSLTSFPEIDTAAGTNFTTAWRDCSSLTSFPLINTAAGTNFSLAWYNCTGLTSFPLINTAAGTNFGGGWYNCSSLTSFPLIDTSSGTSFGDAWSGCNSLTSFPLINTAAGINFNNAWRNCSSLTSFPLIDTSSGTSFNTTWFNCTSLTSFPLINTAAGTNFAGAWNGCSSLTDFPANFFDSWTGTPANSCFNQAWGNCSALTATSVENILNSIDTSGQSAPATGVDITIDYNAGTGTPSVATAITNLKSRGWTITLNGVLQ